MGLRVRFPLRLSPRPHPEETAAVVVLPRIEPGPEDDLLLGAACGPSCSPKDQQLYRFSFVFQPKTTRENPKCADAAAAASAAIAQAASPSALSNTNQLPSEN